MSGRLFTGDVWHDRLVTPTNAFRYRVMYVEVDLDDLRTGRAGGRLLSYDRLNLFSINARDHYSDEAGAFPAAIPRLIARELPGLEVSRIRMVTQPSFLGYVFNPASFYIAEDATGNAGGVIAEVHNRVGQRHMYVMRPDVEADGSLVDAFDKDFYVSPFLDMGGRYRFAMKEAGDELRLGFDLYQDGQAAFQTGLELQGRPLGDGALLRVAATHPATPWKTVAAIYWQALKLKLRGAQYQGAPDSEARSAHAKG